MKAGSAVILPFLYLSTCNAPTWVSQYSATLHVVIIYNYTH